MKHVYLLVSQNNDEREYLHAVYATEAAARKAQAALPADNRPPEDGGWWSVVKEREVLTR